MLPKSHSHTSLDDDTHALVSLNGWEISGLVWESLLSPAMTFAYLILRGPMSLIIFRSLVGLLCFLSETSRDA